MSQDKAESWFHEGPPNRERFMVVATDTFDGDVFPVFTNYPREEVAKLSLGLNQVMEVYNFYKPLDMQRREISLFYNAAWDLGENDANTLQD